MENVKIKTAAYAAVPVIIVSLMIGILAQIKIPLPYSLVPFSGQVIGVLLAGGLLGKERGAIAVMLYLVEGALGMPVFAGGSSGIPILVGPHAGYLLSFPLEAFLFGWTLEQKWKYSFALLVPFVNLAFGTLGLLLYMNAKQALAMGFYPFILVDIAKTLLVLSIIRRSLWKKTS